MVLGRLTGLMAALLFFGACMQDPKTVADTLARDLSECPRDTKSECFFVNSPVRLSGQAVRIPGRSNPFFRTDQPMEFIDGAARKWQVPPRTLTDGASIPLIFVPIVGAPTSPEFVNAAAVHDAYCGIGNEDGAVYHSKTWQETHRMFYDTLIVGGTPGPKAKLMFAAVWLGGPRWHPWDGHADTSMDRLPKALRLAAMRDTRDYINRSDPSLDALLGYLRWIEGRTIRAANGGPALRAAVAISQSTSEDPNSTGP